MKIKMKVLRGKGHFYLFKLEFEPENPKTEKAYGSINLGFVKIIQIKKKQCIGLGSFFNRKYYDIDVPLNEGEAVLERYINIKDLNKQLEKPKIKKIRRFFFVKEWIGMMLGSN